MTFSARNWIWRTCCPKTDDRTNSIISANRSGCRWCICSCTWKRQARSSMRPSLGLRKLLSRNGSKPVTSVRARRSDSSARSGKQLADGAIVRFAGGGYPSGMIRNSSVRDRGRYRVRRYRIRVPVVRADHVLRGRDQLCSRIGEADLWFLLIPARQAEQCGIRDADREELHDRDRAVRHRGSRAVSTQVDRRLRGSRSGDSRGHAGRPAGG